MSLAWFYLHCVAAVAIIIADAKGTLEPALNKFEEKIGIRTELPPDTIDTPHVKFKKTRKVEKKSK